MSAGNINGTSAQSSTAIYQLYGTNKFSPALAGIFSVKFVITTFCLVTNADLAYITWRNKNLRSSCNLLIGICAFATALDMVSTTAPFVLAISGINFMPLWLCTLLQSPMSVAHVFANNMAFFIGFDRLLAVSLPIWYKQRENGGKKWYVLAVCCCCCSIPMAILAITYNEALRNPNNMVVCTLADPLGGWGTYVQIMQLSFEGLAAACYAIILVVLKMWSANRKYIQISVLKALSLILLLEMIGWVPHYSLRLILYVFVYELNPITYWFIINISTYVPYSCWAMTPFILYKFAADYKLAFLRQFGATNQIEPSNGKHGIVTQRKSTKSTLYYNPPRSL